MKNIKTPISDRLKEVRTYHDYKQVEIAKKLGIINTMYCDWELNRRLITLKYLNQLSNFYNINIDYLLGLTNEIKRINHNNIDKDIIAKRLKEIRKDYNLTVSEFAKSLNSCKTTFTNYENKIRLIQTSFCYDIARTYNISVDWLLGKSSEKKLA